MVNRKQNKKRRKRGRIGVIFKIKNVHPTLNYSFFFVGLHINISKGSLSWSYSLSELV